MIGPTRLGLFRDKAGVAAVEFALIVPILILLLVGGAFGGQVLATAARVEKGAATLGALISGVGSGMVTRLTFSEYRAFAREVARVNMDETVAFHVSVFSLSRSGQLVLLWDMGDVDVSGVYAPPSDAFRRPMMTTYLVLVQSRYRTAENTFLPMFSRLAIDSTVTFFSRTGQIQRQP